MTVMPVYTDEEVELARKAMVLRRAGFDLFDIAEKLKVSEARVARATRSALEAASLLVTMAERRDLLNLEVARLDQLQVSLWDKAMGGNIQAVAEVHKIIMSRSRLLGLDVDQSATTTTVIVAGDTDTYIETLKQLESGA